MNSRRAVWLHIVLVSSCAAVAPAAVVFVDGRAATCGDGQTWATAYKYLQDALTAARNSGGSINEIWVAAGTYQPDRSCANPAGSRDRTATFLVENGIALRGGFAGNEDPATFEIPTGDFETNPTILSGDLAGDDGANFANNDENSYRVVTMSEWGGVVLLKGFVIVAGNPNGTSPNDCGGGLGVYSSTAGTPSVVDCQIQGIAGSAVYVSDGTLKMMNCRICANRGIGILARTNVDLTNCRLAGNGDSALAITGTPKLTNCAVLGNDGLGIDTDAPPVLVNCTIAGNAVGAISYVYSGSIVKNCIIWGYFDFYSASVTHSCLQVVRAGDGNIGVDPMLTADGRLRRGSPCIDAGDNEALTPEITADVTGNSRFADDPDTIDVGHQGTPPRPVCDMGALEYSPVPARRVYVNGAAAAGGDGASWTTAYRFLQDAIQDAGATEIWVAAGVYRPDQTNAQPAGTGDRMASFNLSSGMTIYGGFPGQSGQEGDMSVRAPRLYPTILDGAVTNDGGTIPQDNKYQVVRMTGTAVLDGVTVRGGPFAGVLIDEKSTPRLVNSIILDNNFGIYNVTGSATLVNCTVTANMGGVYTWASPARTTLRNCIVWGNLGYETSNNVVATYSCTTLAGTGNINAQPKLLPDGRLRLGSPCIDAGDNTALTEAGEWRFIDDAATPDTGVVGDPARPVADMGAFEYTPVSARRAYVKADALPGGDGRSWSTAYRFLQDAFSLDPAVTEIWVAGGVYKPDCDDAHPDGTGDRMAAFVLCDAVSVYGGFPGSPGQEGDLAVRDPRRYVTILNGDLAADDGPNFANRSENSYSVIRATQVGSSTILDGFEISGGNADGESPLYGPYGGGILARSASLGVANCTFIENSGRSSGAGFAAVRSSPTLTNCKFIRNQAGGMYCSPFGNPVLINCLFESNVAAQGAGLRNEANTRVTNCTFTGNTGSSSSGGIYNSGTLVMANSIVWGNSGPQIGNSGVATITYTCIQIGSGWPGTGNIKTDPMLLANGGLSRLSPCIDAGDNTALPAEITTDLAENPRQIDDGYTADSGRPGTPARAVVDMGAREFQAMRNPVYVRAGAAPGGDGRSWATAYKYLQDALLAVQNPEVVTEVWISEGIYRPDEDSTHPEGTGDRLASFRPPTRTGLYGGFPADGGTDGDFTIRNPAVHQTILSGDLADDDGPDFTNNAENSYHVVGAISSGSEAVLDGLTISGGNANIRPGEPSGGVYCYNTQLTINNCLLTGNSTPGAGGGASFTNDKGSILSNCVIRGNSSQIGGGIRLASATTTQIVNCSFSENTTPSSTGCGGGVYIGGGTPVLRNCSFYANSAPQGSAVYVASGTGSITNSIAWANTGSPPMYGSLVVTYSCVQGGCVGTGNIDSDPLFVDPAAGNLRLRAGSPCVDAGSNAAVPAGTVTDILGLPRFWDDPVTADCRWASGTCGTAPIVDMGAHEFAVIRGDLDEDLDVDGDDLTALEACGAGPSVAVAAECLIGDGDGDGDVDGVDFAVLQRCWTGAGVLGDPGCR